MSIPVFLNIKISQDLMFCEKPHGLSTHTTDTKLKGFSEWLEEKLGHKLYIYHNLNWATSGVISFALTPEKAKEMTTLWKTGAVQKTYFFITDKTSQKTNFDNETSPINESRSADFQGKFEIIKTFGPYSLWKATSQSGKIHQIRLHAQKYGVPILGDKEYGGSSFFRLCLHSESLAIPNYGLYKSPLPGYFQNLELLNDHFTCLLEDAYHRRCMVYLGYQESPENHQVSNVHQQCVRLFHSEFEKFKIDLFAEHWWVYDYGLNPSEKAKVVAFIRTKGNPPTYIREMKNRGQSPIEAALDNVNQALRVWTTKENKLILEMRSNQGMSPGLFIDQRENRNWVKNNSKDKNVLNLFSYTGGFSLAAALGGANTVTTVDLNKNFIDWSKRNFALNGLDLEQELTSERYQFWTADSRTFVIGCIKRRKQYDLIICDPPSFSRGHEGLFRIDKDAGSLIANLWKILTPNGILVFCTNYEKWDLQILKDNIPLLKDKHVEVLSPPLMGLDFEFPDERALLKTLMIRKKQ
jgi:23S rRNA (cytosine1962-C5)-methyltransferase